ncbi:MAG: hypothetical protein H6713_05725 [Myxococcales bacterium]|nr:hypothetical protein [Myxococcales bacterium]
MNPIVLAVLLLVGATPASEVLETASSLAMQGQYSEATALCLEVLERIEHDDAIRQEALVAALGYADSAAESTGDPTPLCRAHAALVDRGGEDLDAFRPRVEQRLEVIAGSAWREVCEPEPPEPENTDAAPIPRRIASTPRPRPGIEGPQPRVLSSVDSTDVPSRPRELLIAGATLTSIGAAFLGGMAVSLYLWDQDTRELQDLGKLSNKTAETDLRAQELLGSPLVYEPIAIGTGVVGSAVAISGIVMLALSQRRTRHLELLPTASPRAGGLTLTARF